MHRLCFVIGCLILLSVTGRASAEPPAQEKAVDKTEDAWRELYLQEARALELFVRTGDDRQPLEFQVQPVMRWVSFNGFNGDVFLWTRGGRPEVIGNIVGFTTPELDAEHRYTLAELHSLSTDPIEASATSDGQNWTMKSGVTLQPIEGSTRPAETQRARLLQARAVAREFSARMTHYGEKWELRRLEKPIHEYGPAGDDVLGGAIFAFVAFRTDPELLLLIEARQGDDGPYWAFLPARFSQQDLWLDHSDQQVWESLIQGKAPVDPKAEESPYRVYDNKLQTLTPK
jgi:hypothetical protein